MAALEQIRRAGVARSRRRRRRPVTRWRRRRLVDAGRPDADGRHRVEEARARGDRAPGRRAAGSRGRAAPAIGDAARVRDARGAMPKATLFRSVVSFNAQPSTKPPTLTVSVWFFFSVLVAGAGAGAPAR